MIRLILLTAVLMLSTRCLLASTPVIQLVIAGDSGTGKTGLSGQWITGKFTEFTTPTIGASFSRKTLKNPHARVEMWDLGGQQKYFSLMPLYLKKTDGIILVYDVTDRSTFINLENYAQEILSCCGRDMPVSLVGNIKPGTRKVREEEGRCLAAESGWEFYEFSVKLQSGASVEVITGLVEDILPRKNYKEKSRIRSLSVSLYPSADEPQKSKGGCCGGGSRAGYEDSSREYEYTPTSRQFYF